MQHFSLSCYIGSSLDQTLESVKDVLKLKESSHVDNFVASVESVEELSAETGELSTSVKFDLRGWQYKECAKSDIDSESNSNLNCKKENKISILNLLRNLEKTHYYMILKILR